MSQGPMSNSPSKGGTMRSQAPTSYQSPFGNQNYRTQTSPSKGGRPSFGGPVYQQPGQFGGQIMNRPMQSPGGKGGQSRPPMMQQPMPSPGGKGGSYQTPPMPYGYGQSTFNPGQFAGYGQPSNVFSFNNPHYQPYMPPTYDSGQTGQSPDIGNNPMTPQPEVMAESSTQPAVNAMPPQPQDRIVDPRTAFTPQGGLFQSMALGGKGGGRSVGGQPLSRYVPPEGYSSAPTTDYDPNVFRVFDPYGEGGDLEGQTRPRFPDPDEPQGPQGTVQSAPTGMPNLGGKGGGAKRDQAPIQYGSMIPTRDPGIDVNQQALTNQLIADAQAARPRYDLEQLRNPDVPTSGRGYSQQTTGAMNSGLGSLFNPQQFAQRLQGAVGGPRLAPSSGPANPYAMGGSRHGQIDPRLQNMR